MECHYTKNILTPFQEDVLFGLFHYPEIQDFYLTGGTALAAFYLDHRLSDDLDLFIHSDLPSASLDKTIHDLCAKKKYSLLRSRKETFIHQYFLKAESNDPPLKIDFVKDIAYRQGDSQKYKHLQIDNLLNIASNKVCAIFGRMEAKDFVDLFFLIQAGINLDQAFEDAKQKDGGLNEFYFGQQLSQVKHLKSLPQMIKALSLIELQSFILKLADEFIDRARPF